MSEHFSFACKSDHGDVSVYLRNLPEPLEGVPQSFPRGPISELPSTYNVIIIYLCVWSCSSARFKNLLDTLRLWEALNLPAASWSQCSQCLMCRLCMFVSGFDHTTEVLCPCSDHARFASPQCLPRSSQSDEATSGTTGNGRLAISYSTSSILSRRKSHREMVKRKKGS